MWRFSLQGLRELADSLGIVADDAYAFADLDQSWVAQPDWLDDVGLGAGLACSALEAPARFVGHDADPAWGTHEIVAGAREGERGLGIKIVYLFDRVGGGVPKVALRAPHECESRTIPEERRDLEWIGTTIDQACREGSHARGVAC